MSAVAAIARARPPEPFAVDLLVLFAAGAAEILLEIPAAVLAAAGCGRAAGVTFAAGAPLLTKVDRGVVYATKPRNISVRLN